MRAHIDPISVGPIAAFGTKVRQKMPFKWFIKHTMEELTNPYDFCWYWILWGGPDYEAEFEAEKRFGVDCKGNASYMRLLRNVLQYDYGIDPKAYTFREAVRLFEEFYRNSGYGKLIYGPESFKPELFQTPSELCNDQAI